MEGKKKIRKVGNKERENKEKRLRVEGMIELEKTITILHYSY